VAEATRRDLQRLLSDTVQRLRRSTGARSVVAWALHPDGSPYVAAADFSDDPPVVPTRELFDQIADLPAAKHLRDPHAEDEFIALGRETRVDAVVPIAALGAPALAALLLDGDITPSTLAALETAAQQVATPLATALSLGRLSDLDGHVRELDRLAALGSLAKEVAHEIRNPLVTLNTFVEVLPEQREDPEFLTRYRDVVQKELRRVGRLLDLMAEHAAPERPSSGETELGSVLSGVAELLRLRAAPQDIEICLEGRGDGGVVPLDENDLRQLLFNLLHNAVETTPHGGDIEVATQVHSREVWIDVRDGGPGIPADERELIFEPFYTSRDGGGGGLGLAIARRIVLGAGGNIQLDDAPGGGTVFKVRLPRN
jgi:signal transduction histidine kinase